MAMKLVMNCNNSAEEDTEDSETSKGLKEKEKTKKIFICISIFLLLPTFQKSFCKL